MLENNIEPQQAERIIKHHFFEEYKLKLLKDEETGKKYYESKYPECGFELMHN